MVGGVGVVTDNGVDGGVVGGVGGGVISQALTTDKHRWYIRERNRNESEMSI